MKICAKSKGWTVETFSNKALAESLDRWMDSQDATVNFLLRSLATTAMVQAVFFSTGSLKQEEWNPYGLALDRSSCSSLIRMSWSMKIKSLKTCWNGNLRSLKTKNISSKST